MPAPSRIRPLAPELANQIAAGEVVERPASVLKELLENSLDAGADRIDVEVKGGGAGLIRVRDNGGGIHPDDLLLALQPHATSKVTCQAELERIASLGFRGEALASIGSVSRLTLTTCTDGEVGWFLAAGAGRPEPAAHPRGTTVEVLDLFYNTPARRKFLRSETTEFFHLEQVFRRLALSRFDVALGLKHNGREVLHLRAVAAGDVQRVAQVAGRAFAGEALPLEFASGGLRLWGWLAPPGAARSQADVQYFYLNGRLVRDRLITHALRQAHREVLPAGRYPAYVLFLEVDPAQVDVNVHPTKHEVRFRDTRRIHDFLFRNLFEVLSSRPGTVSFGSAYPRPALEPLRDRTDVADTPGPYSSAARIRAPATPDWQVRAVLHGRYILADGPDGPALVDAETAQERLVCEQLLAAFLSGAPASRPLLVPEPVEIGPDQAAGGGRALERFGFELSAAGQQTMLVRRVPTALPNRPAPAMVRPLLELLAHEPDAGAERVAAVLARGAWTGAANPPGTAAAELIAALARREGGVTAFAVPLSPERLAGLFETNSSGRGRSGR